MSAATATPTADAFVKALPSGKIAAGWIGGAIGAVTGGVLTIAATLGADRTITVPDANVVMAGSASALTSGRIPFVTSGGLLTDSASLAWSGTLLTANGSAVIGSASLVSTERLRVAGGTDATTLTPSASDVLIGGGAGNFGGKLKVNDTSATSITSLGGASFANASTVSCNTNGSGGLTVTNSSAGTTAAGTVFVLNDTGAGCRLFQWSSGATNTRFGITAAGYAELSASNLTNGLLIGVNSVIKPIIFGINAGEVGRFDSGGQWVQGHSAALATVSTNVTPRQQIYGTDVNGSGKVLGRFSADTGGPTLYLVKSRGGTAAYTVTQSGDNLGRIFAGGVDSTATAFRDAAAILFQQDAAAGAAAVPGRIVLQTAASGGALTTALTIDSAQGITFAAAQYLKVTSIVSAAGTTILDATHDVVVLTGTTTHTFTMPAAATGRRLHIKNRSSGALTVNRAGSDTIDGGTTLNVAAGAAKILTANGTDWCVWNA